MRESEGFCWGGLSSWRAPPPERPMCYWNGRSESNFAGARAAGRLAAHRWPNRTVTLWPVSSASVSVATRKMVNYA